MTRKTCSAYFLAVAMLAAAACSDSTPATAPDAAQTVVGGGTSAVKDARTPYISDLQLHFIYLDIAPDGTYDNGFDITFTNPGPKTDGLYLQVDIQQNQYTIDGGGTALSCRAASGVLPHGSCRMTWWISSPPLYFALGPAQVTVRLMQNRNDQGTILLDSRTVDVVIVHS
jgi:hypothetical protein